MRSFRPTFWPTVFSVPAVLLLIGLGIWQLQRLAWKEHIIETITARAGAEIAPLPPNGAIDPDALEYRRMRVSGRFLHDKEMHLLSHTYRGNFGYHLYTPLVRDDGSGILLINRGWVPAANKNPETRKDSQPERTVTVEGYVRKGWHQGWFVPDNDPGRNLWFYADIPAMAATAAVALPPVFIEAGPTPEGTLPIGGQTRLDIPNDHLQYAVTWFGFAVLLVIIYILYHQRRERRK